jgi:hypothetical protein
MKQKLVPGFVITTQIIGRSNFIAGQFTRAADNKFVPNYSIEEKDAKPFATHSEADQYISRIHNIHNREFTVIPAMVDSRDLKGPGRIYNHGKPVTL